MGMVSTQEDIQERGDDSDHFGIGSALGAVGSSSWPNFAYSRPSGSSYRPAVGPTPAPIPEHRYEHDPLIATLRACVRELQESDGYASVEKIQQRILAEMPAFSIRRYGYRDLITLFMSLPEMFVVRRYRAGYYVALGKALPRRPPKAPQQPKAKKPSKKSRRSR